MTSGHSTTSNPSIHPQKDVESNLVVQTIAALTSRNAKVQPGYMASVNFQDLYAKGEISNCNGNNNSPYFACALPRSPNQQAGVLDLIRMPSPARMQNEVLHTCIHLDTSEAIILIGKTPPEVKYFSFTIFNVTSHYDAPPSILNDKNLNGILLRNKPVEVIMKSLQRRMLFCGMGDPVNNLKIKTFDFDSPAGNDSSETPFNRDFVLVYTSNRQILEEIAELLESIHIPKHCINVLTVPQDIVNVGVQKESNTFTFAMRISSEKDPSQKLTDYLDAPFIHTFRYCSTNTHNDPLPIPILTPRGNGHTELAHLKPVQRLRQSILDAHKDEYMAIELTSDIWLNESYIAMQQGVDNLGESRDTPYISTETFTLPEGAFLVAYGVNHVTTGKALYSNLNVYGAPLDNGVISVGDSDFRNSAELYMNTPDAAYLYAWRLGFIPNLFRRNYTEIPSVISATLEHAQNKPPYVLIPTDPMYLSFRAYVEKATTVGAVWHELILDRVIVFVPRNSEPRAPRV